MLARCPGCGALLEDQGVSDTIVCPSCGTPMRSMAREMAGAESPQLRQMAAPPARYPPPNGPVVPQGPPPPGPPGPYQAPPQYPPAQHPPHQYPPPQYPPPGQVAPYPRPPFPGPPPGPAPDPMDEIKRVFRTLLHGVAMVAVFLLLFLVVIDLLVLVWSWWPVSAGAMRFDSYSTFFIIAPRAVGESAVSGAEAMVLGVVLLAIGWVLDSIRRSGRVPGLAGGGTRFMALLSAVSGLVVLGGGAYLAATGHLTTTASVPNVIPAPLPLMAFRFGLLAQWHGMMIGAILMSAAVMFYLDGPAYVRLAGKHVRRGMIPPLRTDNTIVLVFRMYIAILGFSFIYNIILSLFTVQPEVPDFGSMPLWEQLHAFAEASVWEEVLTRVLALGVPLMLYHMWTGRAKASPGRYLVGGGFPIDTAAFAIMTFQALVFALAHVAGWDLWKVLPTLISGYAFGYLFLKRGVWAGVMLHFTFDYLGMTADALAQWGMDLATPLLVAQIFLAFTGVMLTVHYVVIILEEGPGHLRAALAGGPPTESLKPPKALGNPEADEGTEEGPPRGDGQAPRGER